MRLAPGVLSLRHSVRAVLLYGTARGFDPIEIVLLELARRAAVERFRRGIESAIRASAASAYDQQS